MATMRLMGDFFIQLRDEIGRPIYLKKTGINAIMPSTDPKYKSVIITEYGGYPVIDTPEEVFDGLKDFEVQIVVD